MAVTSYVYVFEHKREMEKLKALALMIAAALRGGTLEGVAQATPKECEHAPPFDKQPDGQLKCRLCGQTGN